MKKVFSVLVVIGYLLVGSQSGAAESYTLGLLPGIAWVQYRVAAVKGFWEKQGITVELIEYSVPLDSMRGGLQRRYDLGLMPMPFMATYRNEGVFDAAYLGTFSLPTYGKAVILKQDLLKKSLKGHTIGMFLTDIANQFFLSHYLNTVNTSLADVRLVAMNSNDLKANFLSGRLQVVLTIVDPGDPSYEQANGVTVVSTRDIYEPHGLALIKQGGITAIPPEDLKKMLRGVVEAIEWMRDPANWEEYKTILKQYVFATLPDLSDDQLRELLKQEEFGDPQTLLEHNQQRLRDYFMQFRAFLAAEGLLKEDVLKEFTYESVIYNHPLIEVLQEFGK